MDNFWAIVLAAGESKRMGSPKMLLPFNGKTMIENVIENISASIIGNILVVLGAEKNSIMEATAGRGLNYCINNDYKDGMLSSVKCGIRNLPYDFKAVLVFQCDQPLISPLVIDTVIEAYLSSGKGIVIPVYYTKRGHPILIDYKYRETVEHLDSENGLKALSQKFCYDVLEVETNSPEILKDIDTYHEYLLEINKIQ